MATKSNYASIIIWYTYGDTAQRAQFADVDEFFFDGFGNACIRKGKTSYHFEKRYIVSVERTTS
jgi:hypothetical protein